MHPIIQQTATDVAAGDHSDTRLVMAYTDHAAAVRRSVLRVVRDPDAADDIVADAFTRLLIEAQRDRWPVQVGPWLYRVAWNLAMSRGRHMTVVARVGRQLCAADRDRLADSPESLVLRREIGLELGRAVDALRPDARAAVLLAAEGFDGNAIAAIIGRSYAATRTLLCRSRARLRTSLAANEASPAV